MKHSKSRANAHRLQTAIATILLIFLPHTALADTTIHVTNQDDQPTIDLTVGDDVWVQITGANPFEQFNVTLKDDVGEVIRCRTLQTNGIGNSKSELMWAGSGVSGNCAPPPADPYTYVTYFDAEADLDGQPLILEIVKVILDATGEPSCGRPEVILLTAETDPTQVRVYAADVIGVPMFARMNADPIYLAVDHMPTSWQELRIFVIDVDNPIDPNGDWLDVRPAYQGVGQVLSVPSGRPITGGPDLLELIWATPDQREVKIVVRPGSGPTSPTPSPWVGDMEIEAKELDSCEIRLPEDPDECLECID